MPDLHVSIPSQYRKALSERFDAKNAVCHNAYFEITKACVLCADYRLSFRDCSTCPFVPFAKGIAEGCLIWIKQIVSGGVIVFIEDRLWWQSYNDAQARAQLKTLREKAKKLIEWV